MKKLILFSLVFVLMLSSVSVSAVKLEVDSVSVDANMLFTDSTVYVPLSAMARVMGKNISADKNTDSVFFNGINLFAEKGEGTSVYINGIKYVSADTKFENGEVYIPAHKLAGLFFKDCAWYNDTATLVFTAKSDVPTVTIDPDKTYAIINKATGKALSAKEEGLTTEDMSKADYQKFKFVTSSVEGYYHIQSVASGKNLDVLNHLTAPGTEIITWEMGEGDNQKFKIEFTLSGAVISARSCHLPLEPYHGGIIQNSPNPESLYQKWDIVEFDSYSHREDTESEKLKVEYTPAKEDKTDNDANAPYRTFTLGDVSLSDVNGLKVEAKADTDNQKWTLTEVSKGVYVITNLATNKSIDVSGRSLEEGGSVITYTTSSDPNQRWILEQNGDGTYFIKSVHSNLYLTVDSSGAIVQNSKNAELKQRWNMDYVH